MSRLALALILVTVFCAACARRNVTVRWRTETELDVAGFVVYRGPGPDGPWEQVGPVIPARGDAIGGAAYTYVDPAPGNARYYLVEAIHVDGTRERFPPLPAPARSPPRVAWALVPLALALALGFWAWGRRTAKR